VRPAPFSLARPCTVDEAVAELVADGGARPLAGGQSLMAQLNRREMAVDRLVDLARVSALREVRVGEDELRLGAMVSVATLEDDARIAARWPLLRACATHVGHRPIRVRSTVGGALAFADAAAEVPLALAVLGAQAEIAGADGVRTASVESASCAPGELIVAVTVPRTQGGWGFHEVSRRRNDRALGGAAAVVIRDERGAVALRLGLSNAPSRQIVFDVPGWEPGADPGAIAESAMAAGTDELTRRIVSACARTAVAQAHGML
jgi:aerobic carbon-monoxide dehydrogenase medium subunit